MPFTQARQALIALFIGAIGVLWMPLRAQPLQAVPALTARVIDTAGVLDSAQQAALEAKLAALEQEKGSQVVLLLVPTTAPEDIAAYANRVGNSWKIGRRDVGDGLIVLVAVRDRRMRIEVAKALEGAVPDIAARQIIDEAMAPRFRAGDYAGGLDAAVDQLAARIRGEPLPPVDASGTGGGTLDTLKNGVGWVFVGIGWVFAMVDRTLTAALFLCMTTIFTRAIFGRALGVVATGLGAGIFAYMLAGRMLLALAAAGVGALFALLLGGALMRMSEWVERSSRSSRGDSGGGSWSSGGSSWSSGGSDSFSSGGGGDFGGGGASGSW